MESIINAIINNPKRIAKIRNAKSVLERRNTIKKLIIGESATQKIRLREDDFYGILFNIEKEVG